MAWWDEYLVATVLMLGSVVPTMAGGGKGMTFWSSGRLLLGLVGTGEVKHSGRQEKYPSYTQSVWS